MKKRVLILIFALLISTKSMAIVSMESLHFGSGETGFSGSATLSGDFAWGNSDRQRGTGGVTLQWNRPGAIYYTSVSGAFGESNQVRDQNEWFAHVRRIDDISRSIDWEIFAQAESEEFARLKLRALGGGGLRVLIGEKHPDRAIYTGFGAFYSHELIDDVQQSIKQEIKGNLYILFKLGISENAALFNTLYYQPNIASLGDYRLLEKASLKANIIKQLSLTLSWELRMDSRPPEDVKTYDSKILTGIEYNF